jgi:hypothetical protein
MALLEVHALKEWQVAVDALEQGKTIMLLRKGGIREACSQFKVKHDRVLLYPTYEHQQPHLLKPPFSNQVQSLAARSHPDPVTIRCWSEITDALEVSQDDRLTALFPFHIWTPAFITERLQWHPHRPLWLLLLRVYRLPVSAAIPYHTSYGGCRSWLDLHQAVSLEHSSPALEEGEYARLTERIRAIAAGEK